MNQFYPTQKFKGLEWQSAAVRALFVIIFLTGTLFSAFAQQAGDYRTANSGKWSSASIWEVYDGANWVAATTAPGTTSEVNRVTISGGTIISLTVSLAQYKLDSVDIYGTLVVTSLGSPTHFNIGYVEIYPDSTKPGQLEPGGGIRWDVNGAGLRIPYDGSIAYPPTYRGIEALNSSDPQNCGDNIALYLGGGLFGLPEVKYATCKGQLENVCLSFKDVNEVGGILRTVPILPVPPIAGEGTASCSLSFPTTLTVLGVPSQALVSAKIFGRLGMDSVYSIPETVTGVQDGGPKDLDGIVNGAVIMAINIEASGYGRYPMVISINKGYADNSPSACRDFGLVTTDTIQFDFVTPPTIDITAPTSVCSGQDAGIVLNNTSTTNYIGVFWSIDDVKQQAFVVAPSSMYTIPVSGAGGSVKYTIDELSYAAPSPVIPCSNTINAEYLINVGAPSSLAINLDENTQSIFGGVDVVASAGCRLISSLISGSITTVQGKAFVAPGTIDYSGRPAVGRRVWMKATGGISGANDRVTIYATNAEFAAFNAVTPDNQFLPIQPSDPQLYRNNVRVYRFAEGDYDPATGLPTVPISLATQISTSLQEVKWNISNQYWEIQFPSSELGLFIIANENWIVLPLKLLSFEAQLSGKRNAALVWNTTEERDVRGFDVEASADGTQFAKVGFVTARNAVGQHAYNFETPMPGKLGYFRLKMIDKNGDITYSQVRRVQMEDVLAKPYPNPAQSFINVDLTGYPAGYIRMVDISGRSMYMSRTTSGMNRIPVQNLADGIYLLELSVGKEIETIKVSVLHK